MPRTQTNGFSLIETLVAVALASIASLALLGVVSNASRTSETIITRFDQSMMSGIMAEIADESLHNRTVNLGEELKTRYAIDRSDILDVLDRYHYSVRQISKEYVDPLMMSGIDAGTASAFDSLSVSTILLDDGHRKQIVYGITTGIQE